MRGRGRSIYRSGEPSLQPRPKREKPKTTPNPKGKFIIHSNHDNIIEALNLSKTSHTIISVDLGMKHYGFRIEKRFNAIYGAHNLSIITVEMIKKKFDKTRCHTNNEGTKSRLFVDLIAFLDQYKEHYLTASMAIIEGQMSDNNDMSRLSQATIDYFLIHYPDMIILELDAHLKSRAFGVSKLTRPELKKWGVDKAISLLSARNDEKGLEILTSEKKKDDLADTIIGIEALFTHLKLQTTNPEGTTVLTFV